jgi:hypothetical protein
MWDEIGLRIGDKSDVWLSLQPDFKRKLYENIVCGFALQKFAFLLWACFFGFVRMQSEW